MLITIENICDWAGANPAQRKFVEGERVLRAKHIIKCGENTTTDKINFSALCLQTSSLKDKPHEINGEIAENKILSCVCTCKAGLGEKCKHIIATLLYIYRKDDALDDLSCTDRQCGWKKLHKKVLENYNPAPLMQHECFSTPIKKLKMTEKEDPKKESTTKKQLTDVQLSIIQLSNIQTIINMEIPNSALGKHVCGRHKPIIIKEKSKVTDTEKIAIQQIFQMQDNDLMKRIKDMQVNFPHNCCEDTIKMFAGDYVQICENTKNWYDCWQKERQYRITGSICYNLYTYTKNKKADWQKKCHDVFTPKNFKTVYTEYGKQTEKEARKAFIKATKRVVIETGLIVSNLNPWLAYSPDGVIFSDGKPTALLEIKCPYSGKTANIQETVNAQLNKFLVKHGENIQLKEKHQYYAQVQLGMAVLNLKSTQFVIYSAYDKNVFIVRVDINEVFIINMLTELKKVYFSIMLHNVCLKNESCDKNS